MNIIEWWQQRRAKKECARLEREHNKKQEHKAKGEKLLAVIREVDESLKSMGMTTAGRYSTGDDFARATQYGKMDGELYQITYYPAGGYSIQKV